MNLVSPHRMIGGSAAGRRIWAAGKAFDRQRRGLLKPWRAPVITEMAAWWVPRVVDTEESPPPVRISEVIRVVAAHFGVEATDLRSARRDRALVRIRQLAMHIAIATTEQSIAEVGRRFNRDHTTVMHSLAQMKRFLPLDPDLAAAEKAIRERLAG